MEDIACLEEQVSKLSEEVFGTRELTPSTEFHSSNIYFGKGYFRGTPPTQRLDILTSVASLIGKDAPVKRVYAAINTNKLYNVNDGPRFAFMHFCERVQLAIPANATAILIGDLDDSQTSSMIKEFSRYRSTGTSSRFGRKITKIVDSVHFCRSHHSRMVQLADNYVFRVSDYFYPRTGRMGDDFRACMRPLNLYPHRYKEWPNSTGVS